MDKNAEHLNRNDPIMQELWAIKAAINKEANYSVAEIARRLREQYPSGDIGVDIKIRPEPVERSSK
jgi:hypothetical protein